MVLANQNANSSPNRALKSLIWRDIFVVICQKMAKAIFEKASTAIHGDSDLSGQ
jgi:hypothetical protein